MHHLYDCNRSLSKSFSERCSILNVCPYHVLFSTLEAEPCKGTAWYKLLMQRPNKARAINYFFYVKMQGSEQQSTFRESCAASKGCSPCSLNKTYMNLLNTSLWEVKGKSVVTQQQRLCSKFSFLCLWQRPASLARSRSALTSAVVYLLTLQYVALNNCSLIILRKAVV